MKIVIYKKVTIFSTEDICKNTYRRLGLTRNQYLYRS